MTQKETILRYMEAHGGITDVEAYLELGCRRLGARIFELKQAGYPVVSETVGVKNRAGKTVHVARYSLAHAEEEGETDRGVYAG